MSATDRAGGSALMQAADFGAVANLRVLLNARAVTDLRDTSGKTALGYARQSGETESVALLERVDAAE